MKEPDSISINGGCGPGCFIAPVIICLWVFIGLTWGFGAGGMFFFFMMTIGKHISYWIGAFIFVTFEGTVVAIKPNIGRGQSVYGPTVVIRRKDGTTCELNYFPHFKAGRLSVGNYIKKRRFGVIVIDGYRQWKKNDD